jgi:hypothetical protein
LLQFNEKPIEEQRPEENDLLGSKWGQRKTEKIAWSRTSDFMIYTKYCTIISQGMRWELRALGGNGQEIVV